MRRGSSSASGGDGQGCSGRKLVLLSAYPLRLEKKEVLEGGSMYRGYWP